MTFEDGNATAAGTSALRPPRPTYATLANQVALLRDRVQLTQNDVSDLHRKTQLGHLDERTAIVALQEPTELLNELAVRHGLAWSTIARLVGVSDAAVRKWRRGEAVTAENRRRLARALAFHQILAQIYPVQDPGSWLEMRISEEATLTAAQMYAEGRADLLFELVGGRMTSHQILDAFDSQWRRNYAVDERFRVVEAPDGDLAIEEQTQGA